MIRNLTSWRHALCAVRRQHDAEATASIACRRDERFDAAGGFDETLEGRVPVDVVSDDRYVASHRALCQAEFEIRKPTFSKGRGDVGRHRVEVRSRRARPPGADQRMQTLVPPSIGVAHARTSRRRPMQSNECPIESFDRVFECESRRPAGPEDAAEYAATDICSL
jgi:hypothetical protein